MLRMDTHFSKIEMSTHVIVALLTNLSVAYWAVKGMRFPINLKKLQENLERVADQQRHNALVIDQLRATSEISKKSDQTRERRAQDEWA